MQGICGRVGLHEVSFTMHTCTQFNYLAVHHPPKLIVASTSFESSQASSFTVLWHPWEWDSDFFDVYSCYFTCRCTYLQSWYLPLLASWAFSRTQVSPLATDGFLLLFSLVPRLPDLFNVARERSGNLGTRLLLLWFSDSESAGKINITRTCWAFECRPNFVDSINKIFDSSRIVVIIGARPVYIYSYCDVVIAQNG